MKLKIALLQIAPAGTAEENLQKGTEYCRKAKQQGADIALFPEMWSAGYCIPEDIERLKSTAVSAEGIFIAELEVDMLRRYRESEVHGNAYRRPELYGMLIGEEVVYPFIRADKKRHT